MAHRREIFDFHVTQTTDHNNPDTEEVSLEINLNVRGNDRIPLQFLTALATDTIINCALSKYPNRIIDDPMIYYRTQGNNDYLGELAQSPEWRQKASKELLALGDQYNMEQDNK